jgi:hypothetical protein
MQADPSTLAVGKWPALFQLELDEFDEGGTGVLHRPRLRDILPDEIAFAGSHATIGRSGHYFARLCALYQRRWRVRVACPLAAGAGHRGRRHPEPHGLHAPVGVRACPSLRAFSRYRRLPGPCGSAGSPTCHSGSDFRQSARRAKIVEGLSSEIETPVPRGAASNGTGVLCANGEECSHASHNYRRRIGVPGYVGTGLIHKAAALSDGVRLVPTHSKQGLQFAAEVLLMIVLE